MALSAPYCLLLTKNFFNTSANLLAKTALLILKTNKRENSHNNCQ